MQSSSLQPDNSLVSQSKSAPNSVASITGLTPESGFEEFPYDPFPYDPNARLIEVSKMFEEYYLDESSIELTLRKWVRSR
jgi:hypothetical protein